MIVRATFENILSFDEETSISFVAGKSDLLPNHVLRAQKRDDISILKTGIIYGANASGKSNIIKAIRILKQIALGYWPKNLIEPYKMKSSDAKPSKLELTFKYDAKYYTYGVMFTILGIQEEWLYEVNNRSAKKMFTREKKNKEQAYSFAPSRSNAKKEDFLNFLGKGTPEKKSFLSEYVDRHGENLEAINKAYKWFHDILQIISPESKFQGLTFRFEQDINFQKDFKNFLNHFNTGVVDLKRFPLKKEETNIPKEIIDDILSDSKPGTKSFVSSPYGDWYFFETTEKGILEITKQKTIHEGENKKQYTFNMSEESDGTLRLLDFLPMLIKLKNDNAVFLIDEIDRSLHPMMSLEILNCYLSFLSNNSNTQLITTTHECNLLNLNLIRQDEVWFVEKNVNGASHLTSLAEYKPREDIRKGYLIGRYGAIPFFASINELNWQKNV